MVGDPYEHIAHFMAQCGNTSREDAWLLQQFVSSLSDAARTRYMHLEPESITSWNDMKKAFLNHFQYTAKIKKRVGLVDLSNMIQRPNETVAQFVSRWRNEALYCRKASRSR